MGTRQMNMVSIYVNKKPEDYKNELQLLNHFYHFEQLPVKIGSHFNDLLEDSLDPRAFDPTDLESASHDEVLFLDRLNKGDLKEIKDVYDYEGYTYQFLHPEDLPRETPEAYSRSNLKEMKHKGQDGFRLRLSDSDRSEFLSKKMIQETQKLFGDDVVQLAYVSGVEYENWNDVLKNKTQILIKDGEPQFDQHPDLAHLQVKSESDTNRELLESKKRFLELQRAKRPTATHIIQGFIPDPDANEVGLITYHSQDDTNTYVAAQQDDGSVSYYELDKYMSVYESKIGDTPFVVLDLNRESQQPGTYPGWQYDAIKASMQGGQKPLMMHNVDALNLREDVLSVKSPVKKETESHIGSAYGLDL